LTDNFWYLRHVGAELTSYKLVRKTVDNVINKLSAVGLISTEEVAVA